jgi:hypothetical protein
MSPLCQRVYSAPEWSVGGRTGLLPLLTVQLFSHDSTSGDLGSFPGTVRISLRGRGGGTSQARTEKRSIESGSGIGLGESVEVHVASRGFEGFKGAGRA